MTAEHHERQGPGCGFVTGLAVASLWVLSFLGAFSIGPSLLPVAFGATVSWVTYVSVSNGLNGILLGVAMVLFYSAYLVLGSAGDQRWIGWSCLTGGGLLAGIVVARRTRHRSR